MTLYAVRNTYVDAPELAEVRLAHRDYLRTLVGDHGLLAAGPLPGVTPPSGMLVFEADSAETVNALLAKDPLRLADLIAIQTVEEWSAGIGPAFA